MTEWSAIHYISIDSTIPYVMQCTARTAIGKLPVAKVSAQIIVSINKLNSPINYFYHHLLLCQQRYTICLSNMGKFNPLITHWNFYHPTPLSIYLSIFTNFSREQRYDSIPRFSRISS